MLSVVVPMCVEFLRVVNLVTWLVLIQLFCDGGVEFMNILPILG